MTTPSPITTRPLLAAIALFCPVIVPERAAAQSLVTLQVGDPVRVSWTAPATVPGGFGYGRVQAMEFLSLSEEYLVGRRGNDLVIIDTSSIRSLERRVGTKPTSAPAMVFGSAIGFAAAFAVGALLASSDSRPASATSAVDVGLSWGVLAGAPIGALGAFLGSRSRPIYEDLGGSRPRPGITVAPGGGVGLSLSLSTR